MHIITSDQNMEVQQNVGSRKVMRVRNFQRPPNEGRNHRSYWPTARTQGVQEEGSKKESSIDESADGNAERQELEGETEPEKPTAQIERSSGISSMISAFQDLPRYSGRFEDNLEDTIEVFETIADVCDVTSEAQKYKAIPIMLKGPAFRQYSRKKGEVVSYTDGLAKLRDWYGSKEKQTRLLKDWNGMNLTE